MLGFVLMFHTMWLVLLTTTLYALYYERIMMTEEAFLRGQFGEQFEDWSAQTPAIIPKRHGWKTPALPFCWRTVLHRDTARFSDYNALLRCESGDKLAGD